MVKRLPAVQETLVQSLGREDPLAKEMATHSSTHAWKIPWMEKPGGLQSMELQSWTRLGDFTLIFTFIPKGVRESGHVEVIQRGFLSVPLTCMKTVSRAFPPPAPSPTPTVSTFPVPCTSRPPHLQTPGVCGGRSAFLASQETRNLAEYSPGKPASGTKTWVFPESECS